MVKVFIAQHPTEAHLVAGLLTSRGIPAHVQGEAIFATRGGVPITPSTLPSVWVVDDDKAAEAAAILREQSLGESVAAVIDRPWTCTACGESVEAQFSVCWRCGSARPDLAE